MKPKSTKIFTYLSLSFTLILLCSSLKNEKYIYEDGVYFDKPIKKLIDSNFYNHNNQIYKVGREFVFNYARFDKNNFKYLLEIENGQAHWILIKDDKLNSNVVCKLRLTVKSGLNHIISKGNKNYTQTVIEYDYLNNKGEILNKEQTGLVENEINIWIHPPRNFFFKILELNPFPHIVLNRKEWNSQLIIGAIWADKNWLHWKGQIKNTTKYTQTLNTEDIKIKASSNNTYGTTSLLASFNTKKGFTSLVYENIDSTKIVFNLEN